MQKEKLNLNGKQRPKSALKRDVPTRCAIKRFDRKGQEIKYGSKYEVTINDKAQLLTEGDEDINSPKIEVNETITKLSYRSGRNLELNSKEEAFLKMLSQNLEKNRRRSKQKECCIIF